MTSEDDESRHVVVEVRCRWMERLASSQLAAFVLCFWNVVLEMSAVAILVPTCYIRRNSVLEHPWPLSALFVAIPSQVMICGIVGILAQFWEALFGWYMFLGLVTSEVPLLTGFANIISSKRALVALLVNEGHSGEAASALVSWGRAVYLLMACLQTVVLLFGCLLHYCNLCAHKREVARTNREVAETGKHKRELPYSTSIPWLQPEKLGQTEQPEPTGLFDHFAQDWIHKIGVNPEPGKDQDVIRHQKMQLIPAYKSTNDHGHGLTTRSLAEEKQNFIRPGEVQHFMKRVGKPVIDYVVSSPSDDEDEMISLSVWGSPGPSYYRTQL